MGSVHPAQLVGTDRLVRQVPDGRVETGARHACLLRAEQCELCAMPTGFDRSIVFREPEGLVRALRRLERTCIAVLLIVASPLMHRSNLRLLSLVRRHARIGRIVAYVPRLPNASAALPALVTAGVTDLIIDGIDSVPERLAQVAVLAKRAEALDAVAHAVASIVPPQIRSLCTMSLSLEAGDLRTSTLASLCSTSGCSLHRSFRRHLGMSPAEWIAWVRLIRVLDELPKSKNLEEVAERTGISAGTHVSRLVRRFEARLGRSLMQANGVASVLESLAAIVNRAAMPLAPARDSATDIDRPSVLANDGRARPPVVWSGPATDED